MYTQCNIVTSYFTSTCNMTVLKRKTSAPPFNGLATGTALLNSLTVAELGVTLKKVILGDFLYFLNFISNLFRYLFLGLFEFE